MPEATPFKLVIEDDEGKRSVVPIDLGSITVGRTEGNTVRLNERNISRQHLRLLRDNGHIFVEDLDSYNGVFINGDRIAGRASVHEGDLIQVGDFHLELRGEGLQRRSEETTQRTLMPETSESTQPEIRVSAKQESTDPEIKPKAQVQEPQQRAEPTAIIRLDQIAELQNAKGAQPGILAGQKPKLIAVTTNLAGKEYEITKTEVVLGRTDDNDIPIDHRSVSRNHAKIVVNGKNYKIVDMGSANGTLVNGEQYAQVDLKVGDLIELGHVKFRFVPPGARYELTDEEKAAIGKAGGSTTEPIKSGSAKETQSIDLGGRGHAKINPVLAAGVGAVVVLLLVIVIWLVAGGKGETPAVATTVPTPPTLGTIAVPEADEDLRQAHAAMIAREWKKCVRRAEDVLDSKPGNAQAKELRDRCELEADNQRRLDAARTSSSGGDWQAAWNELQGIAAGSVYSEDSSSLRRQVGEGWAEQLAREARDSLAGGNADEAAGIIVQLEQINPGFAQLAGLKAQLQDVQDSQVNRPRPTGSKPQASRPTKAEPQKGKDPDPPTKSKPEADPEPPKSKPEPAAAGGGDDAAVLYKQAALKLQGGDIQGAIDGLSKCVQVDRTFCQCYRALGIAYAKGGNGPKAARYYKLYLKFCPDAKDAEAVRGILKQYGE